MEALEFLEKKGIFNHPRVQNIDDSDSFEIEEFLEEFANIKLTERNSCEQLNEKEKTNIIGFENYILKVHPDPDSVLIDNYEKWKQIVLLAENYAKQ